MNDTPYQSYRVCMYIGASHTGMVHHITYNTFLPKHL